MSLMSPKKISVKATVVVEVPGDWNYEAAAQAVGLALPGEYFVESEEGSEITFQVSSVSTEQD